LNLLPLLQNGDRLRRVVSVLAATCEGEIDTNNMLCEGLPFLKARNQMASMETLLLEEAARRAPDVSFVHCVPGVVKSGISRDAKGFGLNVAFAISRLLGPFVETPPDECGERHLFLATSSRYASDQGGSAIAGVPLAENLAAARGIDGNAGSGLYSVDHKDESSPPKVEALLAELKKDGTVEKVWNYIAADFKRITGTEVAF
jgi:hypothetical protein